MKNSFKRQFNKSVKKQSKELEKRFYKIAHSLLNCNLTDSEKELEIIKLRNLL